MLLEDGADVNMRLEGEWGGTALVSAASSGHFEIVKYLVEIGADVNILLGEKEGIHDNALNMERSRPRDKAPCHGYAIGMAAWAPGTELLEKILDAGADVNQPLGSEFWPSVLAIKIELREVDSVKFLVQQARADPDLPFKTGEYGNALEAACCFGYSLDHVYELVEALLMGGADVNMPVKNGRFGSALSAAAWSEDGHRIVKLLIKAGADVNMFLENRDFSTAIALVAAMPVPSWEWGRREMVTLLVEAGAELNPKGLVGKYGGALPAAALFGREETVQYLINAGADINHRFEDISYATALQAAQANLSEKDWEWVIMFHNRFVYRQRVVSLELKGDELEGASDEVELRSWFKRRKDRTACLLKENGAIA
ncbi:hypothetical protein N7493_011191 [Penicillium malachiteum]|uniref:Uncharacterized protein n=1 Tax=Penicillium malachiteum TaxID=1324776 RepID=A0AAD6HBX7_9EURO|nr:hypothetical protein N7493_011191 [Penicillium malachiteum]